jgi:hypothetical protein
MRREKGFGIGCCRQGYPEKRKEERGSTPFETEREGQRVFDGEGEIGKNKRKEKDKREGESSALIERRDRERDRHVRERMGGERERVIFAFNAGVNEERGRFVQDFL